MGEQTEEVRVEGEEEEEEEFEMDDVHAEKRDFGEKDGVDDYINKQREEVEKDAQEEEEIQSGEINLRKFKAGEIQDAVEYTSWMSRVVFWSKVLPTDPCMIGDAQPDLIKILLLQIGVNLRLLIQDFQRNFCGKIETVWQHFQKTSCIVDLAPRFHISVKMTIEPTDEHMKELYRQGRQPEQQRGHWRARICECLSRIIDFQEARDLSLGVRLRRQ